MKLIDALNEYFGTESQDVYDFEEDLLDQSEYTSHGRLLMAFLKYYERKESNN